MQAAAARHDQQAAAAAMAYPSMSPAPPSPTLTNPDMILPEFDESALLTPGRSHSPLAIWDGTNPADMQFDLSGDAFTSAVAPATPFIYGNGTMLSDIGEVTEAESVCGAPGNRTSMLSSKRSTLTMPYDMTKRRENRAARPRRMSTDSNSTVTTIEPNQHNGHFADFDDSVSVGDSNFQGDDEESVAESYAGEESARQAKMAAQMQMHAPNDMSDSSILSRRAEEILANAKRRLTVSCRLRAPKLCARPAKLQCT